MSFDKGVEESQKRIGRKRETSKGNIRINVTLEMRGGITLEIRRGWSFISVGDRERRIKKTYHISR